jgi:hypothetical protein
MFSLFSLYNIKMHSSPACLRKKKELCNFAQYEGGIGTYLSFDGYCRIKVLELAKCNCCIYETGTFQLVNLIGGSRA